MTKYECCRDCEYNHVSYCTMGSSCEKVVRELTKKVELLEAERTIYKQCVETVHRQTKQIEDMRDYIFYLEAHIKELEGNQPKEDGS